FEQTIDLETGHFKIYNRQYLDEKRKMPIDKNIKNPAELMAAIEGVPYFEAAAPRISSGGILSNMENKTNVVVVGIDMQKELETMRLFSRVDKENLLSGSGGEIMLGRRLAGLMGNGKGDTMLVFSQTVEKANNLTDVKVAGIYDVGFNKLERSVVFAPIEFLSEFLNMPSRATEVTVRIADRKYVPEVRGRIQAILDERFPELVLQTWEQEAAALVADAKADYFSFGILIAILLFLAVFIIMNTLTITVFERTAEIGTLRAIGLTRGQTRWMFMWEGIILSVLGIIIGSILVAPLAYYMAATGFTVPADMMEQLPFPIESMKSEHSVFDWLITAVICLITGIIGAILPANRAAKTVIVDALKQGVR
ncbi:MAG TPA: ABC transporter permease, partial [Firmicutes bacterium]|nr:ABC transporter permease [Bacillota bacterium]